MERIKVYRPKETITAVRNNILTAIEDDGSVVICHQVNCRGVMNSGVSYNIKTEYPEVFAEYKNVCKCGTPLGTAQLVPLGNNKWVANIFGQYDYGNEKCHTDYAALEKALISLSKKEEIKNAKICFPYKMGCDTTGGNWAVVYELIRRYFPKAYIYKEAPT